MSEQQPDPAAGVAGLGETTVLFEEMREQECVAAAQLEQVLFHDENPWSEQAITAELRSPFTRYVAARDGNQLVGYAGVCLRGPSNDPEFEIHTVGVDPQWQGMGIGRILTEALLDVVDRAGGPCFLEVRVGNEPAIGLYESLGFEICGRRRGYYQPSGADAWTMVRPAQRLDEEA